MNKKMQYLICPNCGSTNLGQWRQPTGKIWCNNCNYTEMHKEIFNPFVVEDNLIEALNKNEIFVFGSNESGVHGRGAAKTAMQFGAKYGVGIGLSGNTYALPTVEKLNPYTVLPLEKIQTYINEFINFAKCHNELIFLVTEIGCGLAGLTVEEIAPMFKRAMNIDNIKLPIRFKIYNKLN
jgi:ribosomal protein S27AE